MTKQELLLIQFAEELSEVQVSISKALRFGLDDGYPKSNTTNADDIQIEFNEAIALFMMIGNTDGFCSFSPDKEIAIREKKMEKVRKWLKYSKQKGILEEQNERL